MWYINHRLAQVLSDHQMWQSCCHFLFCHNLVFSDFLNITIILDRSYFDTNVSFCILIAANLYKKRYVHIWFPKSKPATLGLLLKSNKVTVFNIRVRFQGKDMNTDYVCTNPMNYMNHEEDFFYEKSSLSIMIMRKMRRWWGKYDLSKISFSSNYHIIVSIPI